jgi:hypothetical protein
VAEKISAPVVYEDLMLVLSTSQGVAAVAFGKEVEEGVTYRYRFLPAGTGAEETGQGKVVEKYRRVPAEAPDGRVVTGVVDEGGKLFIAAGSIRLEWSYSGKGRGWVYYQPEQIRVQIAHARQFEKVDLKRFRK